MIHIKSPSAIRKMKEAGQFVAKYLQEAREITRPGMSTYEYEKLAEKFSDFHDIYPAFYKYSNFPARVCISVNEEVIHGIPKQQKIIQDGDIVSIDFGVRYKGYHGDSAISVIAGNPKSSRSKRAEELCKITKECLDKAIEVIKPGVHLGLIGHTVQKHAESHGFSVVREFVGHGIGEELHEEPQVPNFGSPNSGVILKRGMTLAVEPMIVEGNPKVKILDDHWTAATVDGGLSCHFEHTILVTDDGCELLTVV